MTNTATGPQTNTDAERLSEPDDQHRFVVVSADYSRPFMVGAYPMLQNAILAQGGSPAKWHIFERHPAADIIEAQSKALAAAGAGHEAARANFHTMQGAAAELLKRAQKAETILAEIAAIAPVPLSEADVAPEMFRKLNHAIKLARSTPTPENPNG